MRTLTTIKPATHIPSDLSLRMSVQNLNLQNLTYLTSCLTRTHTCFARVDVSVCSKAFCGWKTLLLSLKAWLVVVEMERESPMQQGLEQVWEGRWSVGVLLTLMSLLLRAGWGLSLLPFPKQGHADAGKHPLAGKG